MSFTQVAVTGSFKQPDSSPSSGKVTFKPSSLMQNGTSIVSASPIIGVLDTSGHLSMSVAANDDLDTQPIGSFYYVDIEIDGEPKLSFTAAVPSGQPGDTIDISAMVPLQDPTVFVVPGDPGVAGFVLGSIGASRTVDLSGAQQAVISVTLTVDTLITLVGLGKPCVVWVDATQDATGDHQLTIGDGSSSVELTIGMGPNDQTLASCISADGINIGVVG